MNMVSLTPDIDQQRAAQPVHILRADDPRHGTVAGYIAEQRSAQPTCGSCRRAKMRYEKQRQMAGGAIKVEAIGTQRRIQALRALGHSLGDIAKVAGYKSAGGGEHGALKYILTANTITATTAARIDAAYEQMSMTVSTNVKAGRVRNHAARMGWLPPLAWDDIDDKDESPVDWKYTGSDRAADFDDLLERGYWLSEACRILDLNAESLERWCDRNGRREGFNLLVGRERGVA